MAPNPNKPCSLTPGAIFWQAHHPPKEPTKSFAGKTILITGATSGIGLEAAVKFINLGASTLILSAITPEEGSTAKAQIEERTNCKSGVIHLLPLNLTSYKSIEEFANAANEFPSIDVAVFNAGVMAPVYRRSPTGNEMCLQINTISTIYLAILLLPKLEKSSLLNEPVRVVFTCSMGHSMIKASDLRDTIDGRILTAANDEKRFGFVKQYGRSKVLQLFAIRQLAARTSSSRIIMVAVCPGPCDTSLASSPGTRSAIMEKIRMFVAKILSRSAEEGSRTIVSATTLGANAHGGFWSNDMLQTPSKLVICEEGRTLSNEWWEELTELLSKKNMDVLKIVG